MDAPLTQLFSMNVPVLEVAARGTAIYWLLFVLFRFVVRRELGGFAIADVLGLVLTADVAQNAMSGEFTSVPEGAVLLGTILAWVLLVRRVAAAPRRTGSFVARQLHSTNLRKGNPS